jgi:hypothetical protein
MPRITDLPAIDPANFASTNVFPLVDLNGDTVKAQVSFLLTASNGIFVDVRAFGAKGDGVTDDAPAFSEAIAHATAYGLDVMIPGPPSAWLLQTPVNCTYNAGSCRIIFTGRQVFPGVNGAIHVDHTGAAFDLTGSSNFTFENIPLYGDAVNVPLAAYGMARDNSNASAGSHRFINCQTQGSWKTVVYGYGSEQNDFANCYFGNGYSGGKIFYLTEVNTGTGGLTALTSPFRTIATGAQSNTVMTVRGGNFDVSGGGTSDIFYLDGFYGLRVFGIWYNCSQTHTSGNGRSLCYVDLTNGSSGDCSWSGILAESGYTSTHASGFLFANGSPTTVSGWTIIGPVLAIGGGALLATDASVVLDNLSILGSEGAVAIRGSVSNAQLIGALLTVTVTGTATNVVAVCTITADTCAGGAWLTPAGAATLASADVSGNLLTDSILMHTATALTIYNHVGTPLANWNHTTGLFTQLGGISAAGLPTSAGASGTLYVDGSGFVKRAP